MPPSSTLYALRGLMAHLHAKEDWSRLFSLLETKPFLANQAKRLGGFQASGDDLEAYALPAAIKAEDWRRFLHYAALALSLRGLAEALTAPEILRALARQGDTSLTLAMDAAGRLIDPFQQARALAAVASGCEDGPARQEVLSRLTGRLDDLAREAPGQASAADELAALAADVGPDLHLRWQSWIDRLSPGQGPRIWRAVAEGWLRRGNPLAPELWQALTAVGGSSQILAFAPAGLGALDLPEPGEVLQRLETLLTDPRDRQRAGATLLGSFAHRQPERACAAWEEWSARSSLVWSTELIEQGREALGRLAPRRIEEIATSIADPTTRAALRIVALESRPTAEAATVALAELRSVPNGPGKLHWSLRYLTARLPEPRDEIRGQILAAGRYLHAIGFAADAIDLARWLDLVARHLPNETAVQLDCVLWSPGLTPEQILILTEAAAQEKVLSLLLERAERCAAALASTEAEGFVLRKELMIRATCRLCEVTGSLKGFESVTPRLLPEEEDELRSRLAPRLAALPEEGPQLAGDVCNGIGDRRLQLVTRLRSLSHPPPETLEPASLYAAITQVGSLHDECRGLMALLETPADPRELLQRLVLPISEPRIRTRALLRLARHTLELEKACHDRPDTLAPLELVRWLITTEADEELALLTPEIAALGAEVGGSRAVAEAQEAFRQLAALETVDWEVRRDALEALLARIAGGLLPPPLAEKALAAILRLPHQLRPETARQALRQRWPEVLPLVVAAAAPLPDKNLRSVRRALQDSLRDLAPGPTQQRIFALCLATPAEREKAACRTNTTESSELVPLAYLLLESSPRLVPKVLEQLPETERVALSRRLLRHGWLLKDTAGTLARSIAGSDSEAEVWCGPQQGSEPVWIERATLWWAQAAPLPTDPGVEPLLARLWSAPERWRQPLAWAVQDALRSGGRPRAETVLRIWLHAHLAPCLGQGRPASLTAALGSEAALRHALVLGPERSSP